MSDSVDDDKTKIAAIKDKKYHKNLQATHEIPH